MPIKKADGSIVPDGQWKRVFQPTPPAAPILVPVPVSGPPGPRGASGASVPLDGDVVGGVTVNFIAKLQGLPLLLELPVDGDVIQWSALDGSFVLAPSGGGGGGTFGGDLTTVDATHQQVVSLQGNAVDLPTLDMDQAWQPLTWDGTKFVNSELKFPDGLAKGKVNSPPVKVDGISGVLTKSYIVLNDNLQSGVEPESADHSSQDTQGVLQANQVAGGVGQQRRVAGVGVARHPTNNNMVLRTIPWETAATVQGVGRYANDAGVETFAASRGVANDVIFKQVSTSSTGLYRAVPLEGKLTDDLHDYLGDTVVVGQLALKGWKAWVIQSKSTIDAQVQRLFEVDGEKGTSRVLLTSESVDPFVAVKNMFVVTAGGHNDITDESDVFAIYPTLDASPAMHYSIRNLSRYDYDTLYETDTNVGAALYGSAARITAACVTSAASGQHLYFGLTNGKVGEFDCSNDQPVFVRVIDGGSVTGINAMCQGGGYVWWIHSNGTVCRLAVGAAAVEETLVSTFVSARDLLYWSYDGDTKVVALSMTNVASIENPAAAMTFGSSVAVTAWAVDGDPDNTQRTPTYMAGWGPNVMIADGAIDGFRVYDPLANTLTDPIDEARIVGQARWVDPTGLEGPRTKKVVINERLSTVELEVARDQILVLRRGDGAVVTTTVHLPGEHLDQWLRVGDQVTIKDTTGLDAASIVVDGMYPVEGVSVGIYLLQSPFESWTFVFDGGQWNLVATTGKGYEVDIDLTDVYPDAYTASVWESNASLLYFTGTTTDYTTVYLNGPVPFGHIWTIRNSSSHTVDVMSGGASVVLPAGTACVAIQLDGEISIAGAYFPATITTPGLVPILSGSSSDVLRGDGTWGPTSGGGGTAPIIDTDHLHVYACDDTSGTTLADTGSATQVAATLLGSAGVAYALGSPRPFARGTKGLRLLADTLAHGAQVTVAGMGVGAYTIECFGLIDEYVASSPTVDMLVTVDDGSGNNAIHFGVISTGLVFGGTVLSGVDRNTTTSYSQAAQPVQFGVPAHWMAVYDSTATPTFKLYRNGSLVADNGQQSGSMPSLSRITIGNRGALDAGARGAIAQVRVSPVARSAAYAVAQTEVLFAL